MGEREVACENRTVLEVTGLGKRHGREFALQDISLAVPERSVFAVLGRNGAGKTTLMRLILGLLGADAGDVRVFGRAMPAKRLQILAEVGSMIETPALYGNLTAFENLMLTARVKGLGNSEIGESLELVGLPVDSRPVRQYSLGMKQRLGLALAILGRPRLLILDEPTNGLDPFGMREMRTLLRRLPVELGTTVVLSTHYLKEVEQIASHVCVLEKGRLLLADELAAVKQRVEPELKLRFAGEGPDARLLSRELGREVVYREQHFVVSVANDDEAAGAISRLSSTSWRLCHAAVDKAGLETFYFDLLQGCATRE